MTNITPVLLAGGSGTRLWPLSRRSYPKQFSRLGGTTTLFQQSALRLNSSKTINFAPHLTLTNSKYRFIISHQLQGVGIDPGPILIEPETKNTAPAILAACLYLSDQDENAVMLVGATDHVIPDTQAFHSAVALGLTQVKLGKIVTFGITPTRPETGYGYMEVGDNGHNGATEILSFIEKPEKLLAETMLSKGNYLWNAGIFMFGVKEMISAFEQNFPELLKQARVSIANGKSDLGFFRLDPEAWSSLPDISIDYAIMEKADNLVAIAYSAGWSDLGDWDAVWQDSEQDKNGVALSENAHAIECKNTLLRSESENQQIIGLGLENIIAVAMPDAVLVCHKDKAQEVKKVVAQLKSLNVPQAEISSKDHRPWGWFESLALADHFQVKRICVKPGAALSLQSHRHRSEHWIVVGGSARVTIDQEVRIITEGQSVYIPQGSIHRMENPGKSSMVLIEVQTGSYFGEDDIVRYEDIYSRD